MNNENKLDRIGVQLQNEPLTISFVSTFCLGCRLLRHRSRYHEIIQHETFKKKSMGVGWGKFYEHGAEAGPCGKRGRPSFIFCRMWNFSKCKKMKPSPLDGLFFVIYAVASVLAETPTSGNNVDTSGENNSTIKDTKMLVCILLCKLNDKLFN